MIDLKHLRKINDYTFEISSTYRSDMRVPARVYATEQMLKEIATDRSLNQLVNVATLPGIQKYAISMPDIHEGYGFPIGGVAAFDLKEGIISPGGIGYDINCGVRLLKSEVSFLEISPFLKNLGAAIFKEVPSGVGRSGMLSLNNNQLDQILQHGAQAAVAMGYGKKEDLKNIESNGKIEGADPAFVSSQAKMRGHDQLGTMGAGNHFVEVQLVETIFDDQTPKKLKLFKGQVVILIHTGSRGLGHQVATDYIRLMMRVMPKYKITLPDRELACVPFKSQEGQNYFKAMAAAANFAFANRQLITFEVRQAWKKVIGSRFGELEILYDVAHNIAKIENNLLVHRKGATRAFPEQIVLIPGSMGTGSYILVGQEKSLSETFGSTCHGAGRRMSRSQAKREIHGGKLKSTLENQGIVINAGSLSGLAEEAPNAYKNVDEVVEVVHQVGIAKKIARLKPLAVIKG